jgi:hypothetical protein
MFFTTPKEVNVTVDQIADAKARLKAFLSRKEFQEIQDLKQLDIRNYKRFAT